VRVDPVTQTVTSGTQAVVRVMIDDVSNLGSYEFTLGFDPGALSFATATNGAFLGSTGRSVICFPPRFETDINGNGLADGNDLDLDGDLVRIGEHQLGDLVLPHSHAPLHSMIGERFHHAVGVEALHAHTEVIDGRRRPSAERNELRSGPYRENGYGRRGPISLGALVSLHPHTKQPLIELDRALEV
jgi:hypothetical protein